MQFSALLVKIVGNPCSRLIRDTLHAVGLLMRCRVTDLLEPVRICPNDTSGIELIRQTDRLCKCRLERCYLQAREEPDQITEITVIRGIKCSDVGLSLTTIDNKRRISGGKQYEQRKRTRDSAVAVIEWMDLNEAMVQQCASYKGVRTGCVLLQLYQAFHFGLDVQWRAILK